MKAKTYCENTHTLRIHTHALLHAQNSLENNLFHRSVRHSPVALFGLDAAETANRLPLVKLPLTKG